MQFFYFSQGIDLLTSLHSWCIVFRLYRMYGCSIHLCSVVALYLGFFCHTSKFLNLYFIVLFSYGDRSVAIKASMIERSTAAATKRQTLLDSLQQRQQEIISLKSDVTNAKQFGSEKDLVIESLKNEMNVLKESSLEKEQKLIASSETQKKEIETLKRELQLMREQSEKNVDFERELMLSKRALSEVEASRGVMQQTIEKLKTNPIEQQEEEQDMDLDDIAPPNLNLPEVPTSQIPPPRIPTSESRKRPSLVTEPSDGSIEIEPLESPLKKPALITPMSQKPIASTNPLSPLTPMFESEDHEMLRSPSPDMKTEVKKKITTTVSIKKKPLPMSARKSGLRAPGSAFKKRSDIPKGPRSLSRLRKRPPVFQFRDPASTCN
eukprot:TRINITY_DN2287_c0_g1_i1.p2 TRINITY_DN2287_c0_g1~~TRINITY_DN2287_c0_g1_i1.p2  ORF type:complete len:379 (-),score=123.09 TRINITY_DN2287_c0_g1_i1:217-1353(-)